MTKHLALVLFASIASLTVGYAQLNDAELGVHVYGATMKDKDHERRWVHFRANETYKLDRHAPLFDNDEWQLWAVRCGAMTPSGFVGYMDRMYTMQEYPGYFYRLDIETGEYEIVKDMCNETDEYYWPVIYDLDWDYSRGKLYGICRATTSEGYASTAVVEVDQETGNYHQVASQIGYHALAMAIDADGYFYTVSMATHDGEWKDGTNLSKLKLEGDQMQIVWQKRIYVDGEDFMINYTNDLAFDHTTGDLYWAADDDNNWQRIIRLDPETGATYRMGLIGSYESINAMYIPSLFAESRMAPAGVKDIQVSYDDNGRSLTISWTNPSTQWNRQPLTSIGGIRIARDTENNVVQTVGDAEVGGRSSCVDSEAEAGLHTYYIIPYNANGNGIATPWKVWAGEDTPGAVRELIATKVNDDEIRLNWKAPQKGAHDGWFDEASLTYDVVRMPDGAVVATNLKECAVSDCNIGYCDAYSYVVTANNGKGVGTANESNSILAGHAYEVPYYTNFDSQHKLDIWTVIDQNADNKTWEFEGQYGAADYMRIGMSLESGARDYLVSPKIRIEEGKTYRMSVNMVLNGQNSYSMRLQWGDEIDPDAFVTFSTFQQSIGMYDQRVQYYTFTGMLESDYSGDIHLSVCNTSGAAISNIGIYDVLFEEVYDYDLAVVGTSQMIEAVAGSASNLTVTLMNNGKQNVQKNTYAIEVFDVETGEVLGAQQGNRFFLVGDEYDFTVPVTFTTGGVHTIAARIVADNDADQSNNVSASQTVNVKEGIADWNVDITEGSNRGEMQTVETRVPFDFTYEYSTCQHIYVADEIGMTGSISRIGYRYRMNQSFTSENYVVNMSLGITDKDRYDNKQSWEPFGNQTLVWSGIMTLEGGEGDHIVSFDFAQPFELAEGQNLVITIEKQGTSPVMWPIKMDCYNYRTNIFRGLRYSSDSQSPFPWSDNKVNMLEYVPHILMAIGETQGIDTLVDTQGNMVNAVYDLNGRRIDGDVHGLVICNGRKIMVK